MIMIRRREGRHHGLQVYQVSPYTNDDHDNDDIYNVNYDKHDGGDDDDGHATV